MSVPEMCLVNLTPHDVIVFNGAGETLAVWATSGAQARVVEEQAPCEPLVVGGVEVPLIELSYTPEIIGLPDPRPGTGWIVSRLCAAASQRDDLYFPIDEVRDAAGEIVGCSALGRMRPGG